MDRAVELAIENLLWTCRGLRDGQGLRILPTKLSKYPPRTAWPHRWPCPSSNLQNPLPSLSVDGLASQSTKKTEAFGRKLPPASTSLAIHLALWVTHWAFSPSCANVVHIPDKGQHSTCALHSLPSHILKDTHPRHLPWALSSTGSLPSINMVFSQLHFPLLSTALFSLILKELSVFTLSNSSSTLF